MSQFCEISIKLEYLSNMLFVGLFKMTYSTEHINFSEIYSNSLPPLNALNTFY